jgi:hypothetical protein
MVIFNTDKFRYGPLKEEEEENNANTRIYVYCYMVLVHKGKCVCIKVSYFTYLPSYYDVDMHSTFQVLNTKTFDSIRNDLT